MSAMRSLHRRSGAGAAVTLVALLLAGGVALVVGLAIVGSVGQDATSASSITVASLVSRSCTITGSIPGLSTSEAANADAVVSAAMTASGGSTAAARIALLAALVDSGLDNTNSGGSGPFGLFQVTLEEGWGTAAQLMDPSYSTVAFVTRLLGHPDWAQLSSERAAALVQTSSSSSSSTSTSASTPTPTPTQRSFTKYTPFVAQADQVLAAVIANAEAPGVCGQGTGALAGPVATSGLPPSYAIPPGTPPEHAAVVGFALAQLGKPYVWGAAGPDAYDCSGLTMAAWATVGVSLVHYTGDQQGEGVAVSVAGLTPGDLVLTPGSDSPGPGIAGHVGIYLGDGLVVSAIDPADGVAVQSWSTFVAGGLIALRDPAPGM